MSKAKENADKIQEIIEPVLLGEGNEISLGWQNLPTMEIDRESQPGKEIIKLHIARELAETLGADTSKGLLGFEIKCNDNGEAWISMDAIPSVVPVEVKDISLKGLGEALTKMWALMTITLMEDFTESLKKKFDSDDPFGDLLK